MDVTEFRSKIKPNIKLLISGKEYLVREVVKFRLDDSSFYIKCFLNNEYVFADDLNENIFLLVKKVITLFKEPFPKSVIFNEVKLDFIYDAHAIAEEIKGEEIFKTGDSERFWDYKAADGSYLSLGINDETGDRLDFYGKIVNPQDVKL